MNKIEKKMLEAIRRPSLGLFNVSTNTTVSNCLGHSKVLLHNNRIALIEKDSVQLFSCGWRTPTTKSRLNAICLQYKIPTINQRKGVWYHNDVLPFEEGGKWSI